MPTKKLRKPKFRKPKLRKTKHKLKKYVGGEQLDLKLKFKFLNADARTKKCLLQHDELEKQLEKLKQEYKKLAKIPENIPKRIDILNQINEKNVELKVKLLECNQKYTEGNIILAQIKSKLK